MSKENFPNLFFFLSCMTILLSACGQVNYSEDLSNPIASFPKSTPIIIYPRPENVIIVYDAYIELKVNNVDRAAENASRLAIENGGYPSSSQTWYVDGNQITTIVLSVPTENFERLRGSIKSLGDIVNESVSGSVHQPNKPYDLIPYSQITLHLRPKPKAYLPIIETNGWNPSNTFKRAFNVFLRIFGFLADIIIWLVVVGGPFLIVFLVIRVIVKRIGK